MWDITTCTDEAGALQIVTGAIREMRKDLKDLYPISPKKYELMRKAVVDIEIRYFASATRETLRPEYKEFLTCWTSIIIKQKDLGASDYLRFFSPSDFQYHRIQILSLFRLCKVPEKDLPNNQNRIIQLIDGAYSQNHEWTKQLTNLWMEYCERVFRLADYHSIAERSTFLKKIEKESIYQILLGIGEYDRYLHGIFPEHITSEIEEPITEESTLSIGEVAELLEKIAKLEKEKEEAEKIALDTMEDKEKQQQIIVEKDRQIAELQNTPEKIKIINRSKYRFGIVGLTNDNRTHSKTRFEEGIDEFIKDFGLSDDAFDIIGNGIHNAMGHIKPSIISGKFEHKTRPWLCAFVFQPGHHHTAFNDKIRPKYRDKLIYINEEEGGTKDYNKDTFGRILKKYIDTLEREIQNDIS